MEILEWQWGSSSLRNTLIRSAWEPIRWDIQSKTVDVSSDLRIKVLDTDKCLRSVSKVPLQEVDTASDTAWVARSLRVDRLGTKSKTKHYCSVVGAQQSKDS